MWLYEHSVLAPTTPASVWRLYTDLSTWSSWDGGLEEVRLDGPFEEGSRGTITPTGQGPLPYRLVEVRPEAGFVDETEIPGTGLVIRFEHEIVPVDAKTVRITHRVRITGPDADTVGAEIGRGVTEDLPDTLRALAERAALGA